MNELDAVLQRYEESRDASFVSVWRRIAAIQIIRDEKNSFMGFEAGFIGRGKWLEDSSVVAKACYIAGRYYRSIIAS